MMFSLINFKIFDFTEYNVKIPLRLRWINKLRSDKHVGNSWKYNQLSLNFNLEHIKYLQQADLRKIDFKCSQINLLKNRRFFPKKCIIIDTYWAFKILKLGFFSEKCKVWEVAIHIFFSFCIQVKFLFLFQKKPCKFSRN